MLDVWFQFVERLREKFVQEIAAELNFGLSNILAFPQLVRRTTQNPCNRLIERFDKLYIDRSQSDSILVVVPFLIQERVTSFDSNDVRKFRSGFRVEQMAGI